MLEDDEELDQNSGSEINVDGQGMTPSRIFEKHRGSISYGMVLDNHASLENKEGPDDFSGPTSATSKDSEVHTNNQGAVPWDICDKHRGSLLTHFQTIR